MATIYDPNQAGNQNQQQNQNADDSGAPKQLQTIGTAAPTGAATSSQAPTASRPQGSGRFTNLQKYLNANKSGGQQVANKIGQNINQDVTKQQEQTQKYNQQLGQSIQNANQQAQLGQQYTNQLKNVGNEISAANTAGFDQRNNQNFDQLNNLIADPNFNQYQAIQAGRGIDENLLANQQQRAYQQAQQTAQSAAQAQNQLSNEAGRFELLRQAFGGGARPGYSTGQQRLDQVLLGQGGGLGAVQQQVGTLARDTQGQAKSAAEQANEVSRLAAQEQGLISDINTQATGNEQAYMDMLNTYIDPTNAQRAAEFDDINRAIKSFQGDESKKYNPGFTQEQMQRLGIGDMGPNTGVFKTFDSIKDANDIAQKGAQAVTAQDVASNNDVTRLNALAKILGRDPKLTQASQLGASYTAAEGDANLKNRIEAQQKQFDEFAKNRNLNSNGYYHSLYGNLANILANGTDAIKARRDGFSNDYSGKSWEAFMRAMGGSPSQGGSGTINSNGYSDTFMKMIQDALTAQNYGRTLGGYRESVVDAYNESKLPGTPKMEDESHITEQGNLKGNVGGTKGKV